ncbi:TIGR04552 family protein [Colwellia sp. TT2012]|uniref:TIGR04552 family protein n=1 Tax=Colwellia sp. TT2012 TaxID=1720342 RepID=UPI000708AB5E|nr:TIGR04552 family protein [Colwellia sp. TT2012]
MNNNPWRSTSVRCALEGRSFIDAKRIHIHSKQEALEYLSCYGFDLNDPMDVKELEELRIEALELIQDELLQENEFIPQAIMDVKDISWYLLNASGDGDKTLMPWSAALLRVIHTLTHSYSHLNDIYHDAIREQIFSRFENHIVRQKDACFFGKIKLVDVKLRAVKSRRSVAMKLLHKTENVAADIFDWIGIRFITKYRSDVLDVFAYLREKHIITYANVKPSRSRNTLIDLNWVNQCFDRKMSIDEIRKEMQSMEYPSFNKAPVQNQFSEASYHSIQITCRQRIKIKQPDGKKFCFYFPFEIQMMDHYSFIKTREGLASHSEYKKRQREAVRNRVLPFL